MNRICTGGGWRDLGAKTCMCMWGGWRELKASDNLRGCSTLTMAMSARVVLVLGLAVSSYLV